MSKNPKHKTMFRNFTCIAVTRGLLYSVIVENSEECKQLVLPAVYKQQVLKSLHDDVGHPAGVEPFFLFVKGFIGQVIQSTLVVMWTNVHDVLGEGQVHREHPCSVLSQVTHYIWLPQMF